MAEKGKTEEGKNPTPEVADELQFLNELKQNVVNLIIERRKKEQGRVAA